MDLSKKQTSNGVNDKLQKLAKLIRYFILISTTKAGSGHPTSSLSGVELMTALLFGGYFRFDLVNPDNPTNDRLIFSKGHASPLFYAVWAVATNPPLPTPPHQGEGMRKEISSPLRGEEKEGVVHAMDSEELLTLRKFGSRLEGHPSMAFPYTEAATGSLGQGLSIGVGMALNAKLDKLDYRTYVLLGDSEMSEGSQWEAMQIAAHYKLDNLIGILDVNRLGQRGETMYGHDVESYKKKIEAFGWEVIPVNDGHDLDEIHKDYLQAIGSTSPASGTLSRPGEGGERSNLGKPKMIIARTIKGKGVSFIENKDGWHGKALSQEELTKALTELGQVDKSVRGKIPRPQSAEASAQAEKAPSFSFSPLVGGKERGYDKPTATRKAYGNALVRIGEDPRIVVLDAEVSNSTYSEFFKAKYPERFFEMYVAEQNMVGAALGLSRRGKIPFVSTFAAFFTRAFDQIRMSQYSKANIKFCGSHAGVSIGEDGASQMGLEDLGMFRALLNSVVLYPSDAVSTEKLVEEAAKHKGIVYIRTTRKDANIIYNDNDNFEIGGSKILRQSPHDRGTVVAAGITLHEALAAYDELQKEGINIRVIDLYSVKPLDVETLKKAAKETRAIITVEDHFAEGGLGEAVASALAGISNMEYRISSLAVRKMPKSGKPDELLDYEEISRKAIIRKVKDITNG